MVWVQLSLRGKRIHFFSVCCQRQLALSHHVTRSAEQYATGPSSNIAFTHHISEAVNASLRKQPANTSSLFGETILDSRILHVTRPPSPSNLNPDGSKEEDMDPQALFNLPSDEETLRLIQSYFANTGVLFPYIHEETFFKTYKEVRSTGFRNKHCWLGMLNVILAMSTSASIGGTLSAEKRAARSNVFFSRAVTLCTNRIRRGASLEIGKSEASIYKKYCRVAKRLFQYNVCY